MSATIESELTKPSETHFSAEWDNKKRKRWEPSSLIYIAWQLAYVLNLLVYRYSNDDDDDD